MGQEGSDRVGRVVILGGGSAGWIVAGVLAARFPKRGAEGLDITLIESPDHPIIGVGEGTWPSIRATLKAIGVGETAFLKACDASFKQGSTFAGWVHGGAGDAYLHPFTLPAIEDSDVLAAAAGGAFDATSFADETCFQAALCDRGLAPKAITTPEYAGAANYAYHLNAGAFGEFLGRHCVDKLGVRRLKAEIVRIEADGSGDITGLVDRDGRVVEGDLFVDCTGFSARLLAGHFGVPFRSRRDVLFNDSAWAAQIPYASETAPIASTTVATAQASGWIWDIGLTSRRGLGHVFASGYVSDDEALAQLQAHIAAQGGNSEAASYRKLGFEPGHREEFWRGNCVAVGLSAGFIEPLEASAIALVELSARMIADQFPPRRAAMARAARLFNATFRYRWERIVEFLKLHYVLSRRTDSAFWLDHRAAETIPERLRENLEAWRFHCPGGADFADREEIFPAASYQYVLYGMGFRPDPAPWLASEARRAHARDQLADSRRHAQALSQVLPDNRELLRRIHQFGLQKV